MSETRAKLMKLIEDGEAHRVVAAHMREAPPAEGRLVQGIAMPHATKLDGDGGP